MENHHFSLVNHLFLWPMFSSYVSSLEGNMIYPRKSGIFSSKNVTGMVVIAPDITSTRGLHGVTNNHGHNPLARAARGQSIAKKLHHDLLEVQLKWPDATFVEMMCHQEKGCKNYGHGSNPK